MSNLNRVGIFICFRYFFQIDGCSLLHESSAESSDMSLLRYFHSAKSNHLTIEISMSPEWVVANKGGR